MSPQARCRKLAYNPADVPINVTEPILFQPLFMERVWGGRRLESLFGKRLPPRVRIGESWEIVDREEAQSVVAKGELRGRTLHELWVKHRSQIFGDVPDAPRFPLLIKLLDAEEKLSVQVHPPPRVARELGGEPKTEFWYIADAAPGAALYVGLTRNSSPEQFTAAIAEGTVHRHLQCIRVHKGDSMFLPSGRVHAIGAGNIVVEVQENSDTTYRVFDWNRHEGGKRRDLHVEQSLRCIDFDDIEPQLATAAGESLVRHESFHVQKWQLGSPRALAQTGRFAILCCLTGAVNCGDVVLSPGQVSLVPAALPQRVVTPAAGGASLLCITIDP